MSLPEYVDVDLPRTQVGPSPQHLVLGLFTDYWFRTAEPLPSSALVALLVEFGTSEPGARAAIARLARRGVLDVVKRGRRTFYGMRPAAARALEQTQQRIVEFGAGDRAWDGLWTTVIFSVPEEQRERRYRLRRRLQFFGYAPVYDGVWMSPRADHRQTVELLESVGVGSATVLRSTLMYAANEGDPLTAWNLDAIRASYVEFLTELDPLRERVARGQVGSAEALVARTFVKDRWRELVGSDPELPENLLAPGWPGAAARLVFARIYDDLGPLAEVRVRQLLGQDDPGLAAGASHRTTTWTPPSP